MNEEPANNQEAVSNQQGTAPDQTFTPGNPFPVQRILPTTLNRKPQLGRGRRSHTIATAHGGHYLRAVTPQGPVRDIALAATLRASALRQAQSPLPRDASLSFNVTLPDHAQSLLTPPALQPSSPPALQPSITPPDLRVKIRRSRTGNLILFVVDASGSMGARKRMVAVKGAIFSLLLEAYQKRDRVGLIAFRGQSAELLVPPTNSVELAERCLRQMPTGGRTPLAAGLQLADQTLTHYLQRDAALTPLLVLVTDGRANSGDPQRLKYTALILAQKRIASLVLDSEQGFVRLGAAQEIARWLEADYLLLDQMQAEAIVGQVRGRVR